MEIIKKKVNCNLEKLFFERVINSFLCAKQYEFITIYNLPQNRTMNIKYCVLILNKLIILGLIYWSDAQQTHINLKQGTLVGVRS